MTKAERAAFFRGVSFAEDFQIVRQGTFSTGQGRVSNDKAKAAFKRMQETLRELGDV